MKRAPLGATLAAIAAVLVTWTADAPAQPSNQTDVTGGWPDSAQVDRRAEGDGSDGDPPERAEPSRGRVNRTPSQRSLAAAPRSPSPPPSPSAVPHIAPPASPSESPRQLDVTAEWFRPLGGGSRGSDSRVPRSPSFPSSSSGGAFALGGGAPSTDGSVFGGDRIIHHPQPAGGSYQGDVEPVQLACEDYAVAPDEGLLIRSTILERCFGPVVRMQANGASSMLLLGQVRDNDWVSRKRGLVDVSYFAFADLDPEEVDLVQLELHASGHRGVQGSLALVLHAVPPGWDLGSGRSIETVHDPSTHHTDFVTPLVNGDGEPPYFEVDGFELGWTHGGASWEMARSQSGLTTWTEFIGGRELHEQPVVGRVLSPPPKPGPRGGWTVELPLDLRWVRRRMEAEEPLDLLLRSSHDLLDDDRVREDPGTQGERRFVSENHDMVRGHPALRLRLVGGGEWVVRPRWAGPPRRRGGPAAVTARP